MTLERRAVTVKAPGKLFLVGEYAVLYGAPAIVRAVDRYVRVTAESATVSTGHALEVLSPGTDIPPLEACWNGNQLDFARASAAHHLVMTLLNRLVEQDVLNPQLGHLRLVVDSQALFHQGQKLGLGSSAAVSHALVKAVTEYAGQMTAQSVRLPQRFVFDAHRRFQEGKGSGADLGAGMTGGTYCYQRRGQRDFTLRAVQLPPDVYQSSVWVGKSASTTDALCSLTAFRESHPVEFERALEPLMQLSDKAVRAAEKGDGQAFVELCGLYGHNLSEFGRTVGIDIVSNAHQSLRELSAEAGVAYKPSGAGNGDFGVAFSQDIKMLEQFEVQASEAGYIPLSLAEGKPCHRI